MRQDIQKIRKASKGEKIFTKHEWMMSALDMLEKKDRKDPNYKKEEDFSLLEIEEKPQMLYEALFIDPSKLTPI